MLECKKFFDCVWWNWRGKKQNTENRRIAPFFDEFKRQMGCNPNWLPGSLTEQWIKVFWELLLREHANRSPFSSKFVFETLKENCFVVDEWTALDSGRSVNACIQSSIRQCWISCGPIWLWMYKWYGWLFYGFSCVFMVMPGCLVCTWAQHFFDGQAIALPMLRISNNIQLSFWISLFYSHVVFFFTIVASAHCWNVWICIFVITSMHEFLHAHSHMQRDEEN